MSTSSNACNEIKDTIKDVGGDITKYYENALYYYSTNNPTQALMNFGIVAAMFKNHMTKKKEPNQDYENALAELKGVWNGVLKRKSYYRPKID